MNFLKLCGAQSSGWSYSDGGDAQSESCSKSPGDPSLVYTIQLDPAGFVKIEKLKKVLNELL